MIEIKTLEIAGMRSVLEALRLPFGKECRSCVCASYDYNDGSFVTKSSSIIDDRDLHLLSVLVKRGDEHSKVLRGLNVWVEINAPRYFWSEADTYRVGTERLSSESTMHIQGKGLAIDELVKMKSELKEGTMQKRIQMFSYQCLRRIWLQRHNHRLPEWHDFCAWIESLPLSEELITIGLKE